MPTPELGRFGAWFSPQFDDDARVAYAVEAEQLGYRTVWLGLGKERVPDLGLAERVLDATSTVTVATAIVNMWVNDATEVAASYHRLDRRHPGRFLLGVGIGHPEVMDGYRKPFDTMVSYLDALDAADVPATGRILAALGPRALRLSSERTAGTHPYLTVPEHTKTARELIGSGALVAPEQKVVVETDPEAARAVGRPFVQTPYLGLRNYVNNLLRSGFTEADVAGGGSDRLIDALVRHGEPGEIVDGLVAHLDAGADHVGIQVLTKDASDPMPAYRALAKALTGKGIGG